MVRSRTLIFSSALFIASAYADLQLSPQVSQVRVDGARIKFLSFSDGNGRNVTYTPPNGWEYSGSSARFTLRPPNKPQAEGTVVKVNLSQPAAFDEATMKKLAAEVLATVPGGSTNVALVSQEKNPLLMERKETFLVVISYTFYGENYQRSMMFLNRPNEQVRFQFVSRSADFEPLQAAFLRSQFTWRNL